METFKTDGDKVSGSSTATNIIACVVETENELKIISKEEIRNKQLQDPHIAPIMRWLEQSSQGPDGEMSRPKVRKQKSFGLDGIV